MKAIRVVSTRLIVVILIVCLCADFAHAQWRWATTEEAEAYSRAFLQSLKLAKSGRARITTTHLADIAALSDLTYELKLAIADYRRGISEIRQFTKSKTESVHLSAEGVQAALKSLVNQHQKLIALITAAADRQDPLPNSTSDIVVKLNQSWQLLIRASIAASYALMEPDPSSGTMRLNITQNQKEALMDDLEKNFGPPIKQGLQDGQRSLEAAAATLYAFLQEPWPTKPE